MPTVHFLNVCDGDCSIIQHGSGRVSVIDICNGQTSTKRIIAEAVRGLQINQYAAKAASLSGNHGMRDKPTEPISYMQNLGITSIFRFILTHPDMDHMDGLKALCDEIGVVNFWDSGVRRDKPEFGDNCPYREEDWDQYESLRDGKSPGVTVVRPRAGSQFQFANKGEPNDREDGGDYLSIVAPSATLVQGATDSEDPNDGSYVIIYRTCGGKIIFGGDAHDETWDYILTHHKAAVQDCAVLIAPHHGRDSDRCYDFLDTLRPNLTLFGCADSQHLGYDAWNSRNLLHITNNQAGNVVLNANNEGIDVYVENLEFAKRWNTHDVTKTINGNTYIGMVTKPVPAAV